MKLSKGKLLPILARTRSLPPVSCFRRYREGVIRDWRSFARLLSNPVLFVQTIGRGVAADWQRVLLVTISASMALFYLHGKPFIIYDDSDPLTYIREAWSILGREGGYDAPYRGPGYPLFLIVTGVASLDVWWFGIGLQVLFAIILPVIIYMTLAPFSPAAGLAAGLCFIAYGAGYNHMNWVMSEMVFLFVQFSLFLLISRYFFENRNSNIVFAIAFTAAYLAMVRPSGAFYFWIFLGVALIYRFRCYRKLTLAMGCYISVMAAWGAYDYYHGNGKFPTGYNPQNGFQRAFAEIYYQRGARPFDPEAYRKITPIAGPASKQLYDAVRAHIKRNKGGKWITNDPVIRKKYYEAFSKEDALLENIFSNPNFLYFNFIVSAARYAYGNTDKILYSVAKEHGVTGLLGLLQHFADHPQILLTGAPQTYVGRMLLANFSRQSDMESLNYYLIGSMRTVPISRDVGPANREIVDSLHHMIDHLPSYTLHDSNNYLSIFGDVNKLKSYIANPYPIKLPDGRGVLGMLEGSMYIWLSTYYGELYTDRLMGRAAVEIISSNPTTLFSFVDVFLRITLLRSFQLNYSGDAFSSADAFWAHVEAKQWAVKDMKSTVLPKGLADALIKVNNYNSTEVIFLNAAYTYISRLLKLPFFLFMIVSIFPLLLVRRVAPLALILFIIYCYNVAALSLVLGVFDLPRYEDMFIFIPVMISFIGVKAIFIVAAAARKC